MGRARRPVATSTEPEERPAGAPRRSRPPSLEAAIRATREAQSRIRAEQGRRGKNPSGYVLAALRAAQSAEDWLKRAAEEEDA